MIPPPDSASYLAYYEASSGTTLSGSPSSSYGKIDTWAPVVGSDNLVQATDADRPLLRTVDSTLVYNWVKDSTRDFDNTTLSIDRRASSFFCLAEVDKLMVTVGTEELCLMSLPGGVGDLYVRNSTSNNNLYWKDGSGTYDTGISAVSSLALYGVVLGVSGIKIVMNELSYDVGTPLSAGTTTGFSLFTGSVANKLIGGFGAAVWYNVAADSTLLASVRAWAKVRKAIFAEDVDREYYAAGASLANGLYAEGGLNFSRQLAISNDWYYRNFGLGGAGYGSLYTNAGAKLGITNLAVGSGTHNFAKRQALFVKLPTNDLPGADSAATIATGFTNFLEPAKAYGYQVYYSLIAPRGDLTAPQETKRLDVNTAMRLLDERRYGKRLEIPVELQDPSVSSDLTYYDADTIHWTKTAFDLDVRDGGATMVSLVDASLPADGLQGYWPLDGDYRDESGYERDTAALNSPTFISGLWGRQAIRCTQTGNNGVKQPWVYRNYDYPYLTRMIWFRVNGGASSCVLMCKESDAGGSKTWNIVKNFAGTVTAFVSDLTSPTLTASGSYADNAWRCVALVTDDVGGKLYLSSDEYPSNLTLRASSPWATTPVTPNTGSGRGHLRFGGNTDTSTRDMDLQDAHLWFGALTLEQLQAVTVEGMLLPP